jgi:hypothetical protein
LIGSFTPGHDALQLLAEARIHLTEDALCQRLVEDLGNEALQSLRVTHINLTHPDNNFIEVFDCELVNQGSEGALLCLLFRVIGQQLAFPASQSPKAITQENNSCYKRKGKKKGKNPSSKLATNWQENNTNRMNP